MRDDSLAKEASPLLKEGKEDKQERGWKIPLPRRQNLSSRRFHDTPTSSSTPLLPIRQRKHNLATTNRRLFGESDDAQKPHSSLHSRNAKVKQLQDKDLSYIHHNDSRPKGIAAFFFGFMYEEPFQDPVDYSQDDLEDESPLNLWNPLNIALFVAYAFTTAATTVPILLIPTIGNEFLANNNEGATTMDVSAFASRAASSAVFGTACGKFLNGPVGDVFGARRTAVLYAFFLSASLFGMAFCNDIASITWACYYVEFFQSVQWPCILITLGTHYGPQYRDTEGGVDTNTSFTISGHSAKYENGIYVTSIASRFGAIVGIPFLSLVLRRSHWRVVCLTGAWIAMIGASISYLFVADSPLQVNEPQNALHPSLINQISQADPWTKPRQCLRLAFHVIHSVLVDNLFPSLQHVIKSGTFWIVALAHTGSSMVRTSERILSTYYLDTSMGTLSEEKASGLSVFASFGTIAGVVIVGTIFSNSKERQRKRLVSKLYVVTIASCYLLAILAIPRLRLLLDAPDLVLLFQIMASFTMAFGIAVMLFHIPGLVSSAFGNHKGLFSSYVDGVAYGLASFVWKIVASSVEEGNSEGGGWAYGWAAVALLIIMCAVLMVEFMEHYFVRTSGRYQGTYETIIFA